MDGSSQRGHSLFCSYLLRTARVPAIGKMRGGFCRQETIPGRAVMVHHVLLLS